MNTFEQLIRLDSISGPGCTFYSVLRKGSSLAEFSLWQQKVLSDQEHADERRDINQWLVRCSRTGAHKQWFRHEGAAHALPPRGISSHMLRLYCFWVSPEVVILFNGGLKTGRDPQQCPNVSTHFKFAKEAALELDQLFARQDLQLTHLQLISPDGSVPIHESTSL